MHGATQRAIDVVTAAHFHRRIQPRQRGAGLYCFGNRNVRPVLAAETYRFAAVQIHRDHVQLAIEVAKIIRAPAAAEDLAQEALDFGVVEQSGWHQSTETLDEVRHPRLARVEQAAPPFQRESGQRRGAAHVFEDRRTQESFRAETHVVAFAGDEDPAHLGG